MAQDYKAIDENENMSDAPARMKKNDEAIISNFAGAEEPTTKMQGQLYFDTSTNTLKFYNGSNFVANIPCNVTGTAARAKADESGRVIADTYLGKNERAKTSKALQTLERNTAYAVGDIAYCEQLPAGYYLECVTAGTTGNVEPTFKVGGVKVLDGSVEWNIKGLQDFLDTAKGGTIYAPASLGNTNNQNVVIAQGAELSKDTNDTSFSIHGGICQKDTDEANGASLELFGQDFEAMAGYFTLIAKNKSARCQLLGTPSGNLLWNDNEIVTSQHEITSKRVLRLNNGWQICIDHNGSFSASQGVTQFTWNYPVPFASNPFVLANTVCMNSKNFEARAEVVDINRTVGYIFNTGTPANIEVYFLAIGRWK